MLDIVRFVDLNISCCERFVMYFIIYFFWLVGFCLFFVLVCLVGVILLVVWVLIFSGMLLVLEFVFIFVQWYVYEMFFGFGWVVFGGFLLILIKNWVNICGYYGLVLMLLVGVWIIEWFGMSFGGGWLVFLLVIVNNLFFGSIVVMLLWMLICYCEQDSYWDNVFFLVMLFVFFVVKYLMFYGDNFMVGYMMVMGLFCLVFLVMFECILIGFMKVVFQVNILCQFKLDMMIKLFGLLLVVEFVFFRLLIVVIVFLLVLLFGICFIFWKLYLVLCRIDIGIMYVGYLVIICQLLIEVFGYVWQFVWIGLLFVYFFIFGVMGMVIFVMIIWILKGYIGCKVVFDCLDKLVFYVMLVVLFICVFVLQIFLIVYL